MVRERYTAMVNVDPIATLLIWASFGIMGCLALIVWVSRD